MSRKRLRLALVLTGALIATMVVPSQGITQSAETEPGGPVDLAIEHLTDNLDDYQVGEADIADLVVTDVYQSSHNDVTHVYLRQSHDGLEVVGGNVVVNLTADGSVLHTASRLVSDLAGKASGQAELAAADAVEEGAEDLGLEATEPVTELESTRTADRATVLSDGGISAGPIPAKLVYQPTDDGRLRLAWQVEIEEPSGDHWWIASIDAETGEVLDATDQVDSDDIRDIAEAIARPGSSAQSALGQGAALSQSFQGVPDGSSYRVYALPFESPLDGDRTLVSEPADPVGSPFGWHDTTGTPAPDFTVTRGNNVHAYTDTNADNQPDPGSDPDGGPGLTFDFPIDFTQQPDTYADAAVTNLFYWNNIIHDITYRYGFDEVSGNFQVNNYGNGGLGNDDVRAEAQDGAGLNNANFGTPSDGNRPRMQMFLWDANAPGLANRVTVDPPSSAAGTYQMTGANFGPPLDETGLSGDIVLVNDGSADPTLGCDPLVGFPEDAIALMDRGECPFVQKVNNAQDAGAVAVIIANNDPGNPITLGGTDPNVVIPSGMISLDDGTTIRNGLPASGSVFAGPPIILRDGDLDAGIIIHEYAHGISNRLTGGPSNVQCLGSNNQQQQMGEGWSDWYAIAYTAVAEDQDQPRGVGAYALRQDEEGRHAQGIRPTAYSTDKNVNPMTYANVRPDVPPNLSVPHGVGYVFANMLWEVYWDLVDKHGFNPDVYGDWTTGGNNLAIQLVTDGMKLQSCLPGFVDGRDAIMAADMALTGGDNQGLLWHAWARRGLGASAVQGPPPGRTGIVEDFDVPLPYRKNQFRVDLSGANEVGGGDPDGSGGARVSWNQSGRVCFDIRVEDIAPATAAHIHAGGHGVDGPIVVDFDVANNGLQNCVTGVDPALLQEIRTRPSQYYVNVHNADFPAGALRGQLD